MRASFNDEYSHYKGHIEIWKYYTDGRKELHYEDQNVVCSGMGATIATAFAASGGADIRNFQITLFQMGTAGSTGLQVSSNGKLGTPLTYSEYGAGILGLVTQNLSASGTIYTNQAFAVIPTAFIDKVSDRKCRWRLVLDENAGNSLAINEVGLFSKNPIETNPATAFLCAYRFFTALAKTNEYALHIIWTIQF